MNIRLKKARKKKGLTQEQMARKLGYRSKSGYAMIENGRNQATVETAINIAEILDETVEYLFGKSCS
jgi:transcriptional regulator with XRE-family HTH domain